MCTETKLNLMKIYVRNYKACVQHKILIVARSFRPLVKSQSNLTTDRHAHKFEVNRPHIVDLTQDGLVLGQAVKLMKIYVRNYKECVQHEIVIVARSARSYKDSPTSQPIRHVRKFEVNCLLTEKRTQEGLVFGQAIVFRACEQCVIVRLKPIDWHVSTQKYLNQPEEPDAFIELLTEQSLHVINIFIQRVIVRRSTVQREYEYR